MSALTFDTVEIGNRSYKVVGFYRPYIKNEKGQLGRGPVNKNLIELIGPDNQTIVTAYPFEVYPYLTHFRVLKDGVDITGQSKVVV